ncbi:DUF1415 domain-containing protein [Thiomicrorhabdus heinhorstiae]|uniref:DUF1415 domain-containing protein n=1 Tax=Thiomicrorhabdus heinhorstiae TaxID=2748010 RepID=A0ABS0BTF0_9GAMM|nr:DUF1415 domain-containing protein [Thiomicrorhabdus heinhorstiae]MBF6057127.1 DUF1415 domain-containing protein [Thiomicrorhabdus heinhorstiae]
MATGDNYRQEEIDRVKTWLEQVVIGLNLCPFAKHPYQRGQVHFVVSLAEDEETLLQDLLYECRDLKHMSPKDRDTTLIIIPEILQEFDDFNNFLDWSDALLYQQGWRGVFQIATFHPDYHFAHTEGHDADNLTNRAPLPILHILREDSVERALELYPDDPETIFRRNIETVRNLTFKQKRELFPYLAFNASEINQDD